MCLIGAALSAEQVNVRCVDRVADRVGEVGSYGLGKTVVIALRASHQE